MEPGDISSNDLEQYHAIRFLIDLKDDPALRVAWTELLTKVNDSKIAVKDKLARIHNFLLDHGYETSAEEVLRRSNTTWWKDFNDAAKPTPASDRFVQDLLQNSLLFQDYLNITSDALDQDNSELITKWLRGKGYDCSPAQVQASFRAMRNVNFNLWAGTYGSTLLGTGDDAKTGPVLILYGDDSVALDAKEIIAPRYSDGELKWDRKTGHHSDNANSAILTFSRITMPRKRGDYVGPVFNGQLINPTDAKSPGAVEYNGKLGDPPANSPASKDAWLDKVSIWCGILNGCLSTILFAAMFIHQVKTTPKGEKPEVDTARETLRDQLREADEAAETVGKSPLDSDMVARLQRPVDYNLIMDKIAEASEVAAEALRVQAEMIRRSAERQRTVFEDSLTGEPSADEIMRRETQRILEE